MVTPVTATGGKPPEIYAIQLLRAVAASLVVVDHILLRRGEISLARQNVAWALGDLGVETFFVVSGCLMIVTSQSAFGRPGSPIDFIKRRFLRIAPLYWLMTTLLLFLMMRAGTSAPFAHVISSYLFIPYPESGGAHLYPVLTVGWTLNYEMFFYVIFALTLTLERRTGILALCCVFGGLVAVGSIWKPLWETRDPATLLEAWTDPIILSFLAGCLIALLRPAIARGPWPAVSPLALAGIASLLLLATCAAVVLTSDVFPRPPAVRWSMRAAAIAAVLVCLVPHGPPTSRAGRLLYLLGNASFSTYLVHSYAIRYGLMGLGQLSVTNEVLVLALLLVFANALGLAVHLAVEMPMLRAIKSERGLMRVFQAGFRRRPPPAPAGRDL